MKHIGLKAVVAIGILFTIVAIGLMVGHASTSLAAATVEIANITADKIGTELLNIFQNEGQADFVVRFTEQADLTPAFSMDWEARGEYVYNTLKAAAVRSQAAAKVILDARGLNYQTFIAGNELYVWSGDLAAASDLATLPEVDLIRETRTYYIEPVKSNPNPLSDINWAGDLLANNLFMTVMVEEQAAPDALAWGIVDAKADQFWTAFGVQGNGIVVANIDTGVQWDHPALDQAYKCGTDPTDPACWEDPANICGGSMCDNNGHGTHTMGTMVADDDPGLLWQAGMAPDAQWIACKGCETNSCSDYALNTCADWILAPDGDPANRPHIVNNSWGGGTGTCDTWYLPKVNAWRAAGTFPAFSAGNASTCSSLGNPGVYQESFGTTGHSSTRAHYGSMGPAPGGACDPHTPYTKPNISSPAVSVCSTVPGSGWSCGYTGTSMASPHSAGAVALLWSCNPTLIGQMPTTFEALQNSADTPPAGACGAPPDGEGNYTSGYGFLNVLQAGVENCGNVDTGYLEGHVYDLVSGDPIAGANVTAAPAPPAENAIDAITDPNGYYTMTLVVGTYDVTAVKPGYADQTASGVEIIAGAATTQDFDLEPISAWTPGPSMCFDFTRFDAEYFPGNEKVYILGGRYGADTFGDIYEFDPLTEDCVDTGANMPTPISNYTVNLINDGTDDLLCTFGGRTQTGAQTLDIQCYDPIANSASTVGQLPAAYTGYVPGAQVVYNNHVYVFGGFNPAGAPYELARTDRYDPVANSFTQIGNLNLGRSYINATVVDGMIFAFGGTTFDGANLNAQTVAEVMADPEGAGTWNDAAVADLPMASAEGRAYGFDSDLDWGFPGQIVIAGGGQWPGETADALKYDVASNTYDVEFPDLIDARRDHAGVTVPICTGDPGDALPAMWVFGGRQGVDDPPYMPSEYFPLACGLDQPNIVVDAPPLEAGLFPNQTISIDFTIGNIGFGPLDWYLFEISATFGLAQSSPFVPAGEMPVGPIPEVGLTTSGGTNTVEIDSAPPRNPEAVLWDQPVSGSNTNVYANQDFETDFDGYDIFIADDFTNSDIWMVDTLFVPGNTWNAGGDLTCANSFTWQIYADDGGMPDGDPWGGGNPPVWNLSLPPDDPQVTLSTGVGGFLSDVTLSIASPVSLPPGTWWLVFYPQLDFATCFQYGRHVSDTANGSAAMVINPGGGFGFPTVWTSVQDPSTWGLTQQDFAFRLEGSFIPVADIPWLSEDPISGTLDVGEVQTVTVTYDSTGLSSGDYFAELLISSNDPVDPILTLPVTLTVYAASVDIDTTEPAMMGDPGMDVTYTLQVANLGDVEDTFDISASGNSWMVNVLDPVVTVPSSGVVDVEVVVQVPMDALAGDMDMVAISATSQGDPAVSDTVDLTTAANQVYGVELSPETAAMMGAPGERVEYTLTLMNTGNGIDTFDLTAVTNWNVHFPDPSVTVPPSDSMAVIVHVDVPSDAAQGDFDTALIEAASQGDPTVDDSSSLTTSIGGYMFHLPIVFK